MLTLLRKAHVFAPDDLGVQDVLIARDRIAAIGNDLPGLPSTLEHREVDLSGHMLIPGLIDAHVHVTGGGGEAGPETRVPPIQLTHLSEAGVTSCVGVLGTDGTTRTVRDLVATTMGLRALGLSAWCYTGSYQIPPPTLTGSVRDDIVYVDPIIGIGELALSDHRSSQPTLDEFLRVASDAYVAGMIANKAGVVHCHMGSGERGFKLLHEALDIAEIPPRVYHPTHINRERWLFEEAKSLAERGVTCDVTAFPDDGETMLAAEAIMRWRKEGGAMERLTVSSDGAGCLPNFDEGAASCPWMLGDHRRSLTRSRPSSRRASHSMRSSLSSRATWRVCSPCHEKGGSVLTRTPTSLCSALMARFATCGRWASSWSNTVSHDNLATLKRVSHTSVTYACAESTGARSITRTPWRLLCHPLPSIKIPNVVGLSRSAAPKIRSMTHVF